MVDICNRRRTTAGHRLFIIVDGYILETILPGGNWALNQDKFERWRKEPIQFLLKMPKGVECSRDKE